MLLAAKQSPKPPTSLLKFMHQSAQQDFAYSVRGRINSSHVANCSLLKIDITLSALDFIDQQKEHCTLENWYCKALAYYARIGVGEELERLYNVFASTYNRIRLDPHVLTRMVAHPGGYELVRVLSKWGFVDDKSFDICNHDIANGISAICKSPKLIYTPAINISFGSLLWLFQVICYKYLCNPHSGPITIYILPSEMSIIPDLERVLIGPDFQVRNIYTYILSIEDLRELKNSGGHEKALETASLGLFEIYGISSSDSCRSKEEISEEKRAADLYLLRHCSKLFRKRSSFGVVNHELPASVRTLAKRGLKLIGVTNRDSSWIGPGQEWRNTSIELLEPMIMYLISLGYGVIRLNTKAVSSGISHENFVDLAGTELGIHEQLAIYQKLDACIGCGSGITSYPSQLFFKKTLWLDMYSTRVEGCLLGEWAIATKVITVTDFSRFSSFPLSRIIMLFESQAWSFPLLEDYGLAMRSQSPQEIINCAKAFISRDWKSNCVDTHDFFARYGFASTNQSQSLMMDSALKLAEIINCHPESKSVDIYSSTFSPSVGRCHDSLVVSTPD